jgi:hypothetical protein
MKAPVRADGGGNDQPGRRAHKSRFLHGQSDRFPTHNGRCPRGQVMPFSRRLRAASAALSARGSGDRQLMLIGDLDEFRDIRTLGRDRTMDIGEEKRGRLPRCH